MGKALRPHQAELRDAHGLHGTRRGADVAGVRRPQQDDADSRQRTAGFHTRFMKNGLFLINFSGLRFETSNIVPEIAPRRTAWMLYLYRNFRSRPRMLVPPRQHQCWR